MCKDSHLLISHIQVLKIHSKNISSTAQWKIVESCVTAKIEYCTYKIFCLQTRLCALKTPREGILMQMRIQCYQRATEIRSQKDAHAEHCTNNTKKILMLSSVQNFTNMVDYLPSIIQEKISGTSEINACIACGVTKTKNIVIQ